jgi:glucose-1-phosphate cytidylyltransferase
MKVVLFCGGLGTRMRGQFQDQPKPLVNVGPNALVWNVMRYYAHHGHTDFILCLGYGAAAFTRYFEEMGAEIIPTISSGGPCQCFRLSDGDDGYWNVTLVDTGMHTSIGQRLKAVQGHIGEEEIFLANYADGLSDLPLQGVIDLLTGRPDAVGALVAVRPVLSFHYILHDAEGMVTNIKSSADIDVRINGGYFVFRREIFDFIEDGDDLVERPFERLIAEARLLAAPHDGFWRACDTLKDVQVLSDMQQNGSAPWEIWRKDDEITVAPLPAAMISPAA